MGRIEALTRLKNSLKKVGIRTRTESEEGDGFGKWVAPGPADKQIGTSKAAVYASLAGRNRAADVWRQKAQFDDGYQEFLAAQGRQAGNDDTDEDFEEGEPDQGQQQQHKYELSQKPQVKPCNRSQPPQQDFGPSKARARHSSVSLYAADVIDSRQPSRQIPRSASETSAAIMSCILGYESPSPQQHASERDLQAAARTNSFANSAANRAPLLSPLGNIGRVRTSVDNCTPAIAPGEGGVGGGGGGDARPVGVAAATGLAISTAACGSGPTVFSRSSACPGGDVCGVTGTGIASFGNSSSWGSCSCGVPGGAAAAAVPSPPQHPSPAAGGGSFLRRQGSSVFDSNSNGTIAPACASPGSNLAAASPSGAVRLPSLRQLSLAQQPSGAMSARTLRPATAAAAGGVSSTTSDGAPRHYYQPQPPTTAQPSVQHQHQHQQRATAAVWDVQRSHSAGEPKDVRSRDGQAGGGVGICTAGCSGRRLVPPARPSSPSVPPSQQQQQPQAALTRGMSTQSLMNMLMTGGASACSLGSCGGTGFGASTMSTCYGSNGGRETQSSEARTEQVAAAGTLDEAIPFDIVEDTGRWFDAGDLSYCNPECDDEMAQILDELVQSSRNGSITFSNGGSFTRGGRPQSGLSHGSNGSGVPTTPRGQLIPSSANVRLASSVEVFPQQPLADAALLPAITGSSGGGSGSFSARRGGGGGGGSAAATLTGSFTAGGGSAGDVGGGVAAAGCRGSDSLLPRLPWPNNMYGSGSGAAAVGSPGSPGSSVSPSGGAGGSPLSPCASPRSFHRSSITYGSGVVVSELDSAEDVNLGCGGTAVIMRQPSQSLRRSSQLLIQAAGRRASTGLPPNLMTAAAAGGLGAGAMVGPETGTGRSQRGISAGGTAEAR